MSVNDQRSYGEIARGWVGLSFHLGIAANSLKLTPTTSAAERYVWIDPPWWLWRDQEEVASGADCPATDEAEQKEKFKWFCDLLSPLEGARLEAINFLEDGTSEFCFESGLRLVVGHTEEPESERLWYDDWYAKDAENSVQEASGRRTSG